MHESSKKQYVFLAGGLTGGPIMPLLSICETWQIENPKITPVILDVRKSTSRHLAKLKHIPFHSIITGKFRRYWSIKNVFSPILVLIGFIQSIWYLWRYRPIAILGAGGFVQLPLLYTAWIFRIPRFIHQQDVLPSLANQLSAPVANIITTTFESSLRDFLQGTGLGKKFVSTNKVFWTGNPSTPIEKSLDKTKALQIFNLSTDLPVLLVVGGATGSAAINELIISSLDKLTKVVQIIHLTGSRKTVAVNHFNYHPYEFLDNIHEAYAAADVVLGRAGIGTLTDLAKAKKPSIIVPMPETHQEFNAELIYQDHAALVVDQSELDADRLVSLIRQLLFDLEFSQKLVKNMGSLFPKNANQKVFHLYKTYLKDHGYKI